LKAPELETYAERRRAGDRSRIGGQCAIALSRFVAPGNACLSATWVDVTSPKPHMRASDMVAAVSLGHDGEGLRPQAQDRIDDAGFF
jgi:hypothetical protein